MNEFIELLAAVLAAMVIMVIHELPKSFVYRFRSKDAVSVKKILGLSQYIDPIGLLFCVITNAGFSKPYRYKFESKRKAILLGITGFTSLLVAFLCGVVVYESFYAGVEMQQLLAQGTIADKFLYWFVCFFVLNSLGMLVVNLFPIGCFDMGLCIAGISLPGFIAMIRRDTVVKLLLFLVLYLESIPNTIIKLVNYLLS